MPSTPDANAEVERRIDAAVARSIAPAAGVLAVLLTLLAVSHPFIVPKYGVALAALAGASAILLAAAWLWPSVRNAFGPSGHTQATCMTLLLLGNCAAMLAATQDPIHTTNFLLLEVGLASMVLDVRRFAWLLAAIIASWVALAVWARPHAEWLHYFFALLSGTALASIIFAFRLRNFRALLTYQLRDEQERRRLAARDLSGAASRFQVLVEQSLVGIVIIQDGKFVYANSAAAKILGHPQSALMKGEIEVTAIAHPADRERMAANIRKRIDGEIESMQYEFRLLRGDGSTGDVQVFGARSQHFGRPAIAGMVIDVTQRMRAERELREKQRELATLISNLPGMAYRCRNDAQWTIEFISDGCREMTGHAPDELIGNRTIAYADLIEPDDQAAVWADVQAALEKREPFRLTYRLRHRDGATKWVWEQGRGVYATDGSVTALEGFITDITDRVAAEERVKEASRLKSAILANMSHEIRTPMTAVIGFSDLLVRKLKGTEWQRDAEIISAGGRRLLHLLNNVLDLARIESGKADLKRQAHPVQEPIERVVRLLRVLAEKKSLMLTAEFEPGLLIAGDPHAEEQVWTNIIGNGIKFTEHGGVHVRAFHGESAVVVEVIDTGVGIGATFLPHLFEEFRQESEGISRSFEGSGLGLTIAKRLVNAMDGEITVLSTKGAGTTVRVMLPKVAQPVDSAHQPNAEPAAPPARRRVVLLVEDDPASARLVSEFLTPAHEVVWRSSGDDAETLVRARQFDIILLDVNLKNASEDGISVMRRLRNTLGTAAPTMAALTAYALAGDEERFREAGFDAYLAKPFDPRALLDLVETPPQ